MFREGASLPAVTADDSAGRSDRTAIPWASLAVLAAGHFAVDSCTGIWPIFKTLAHLDLSRAGLIASVGSMVGNGFQIGFGPLADRGWRKPLLVGGVLLAGAVTLVPFANGYGQMFALVLMTYVGSAAFHPSGTGSAGTLLATRTGVLVGFFLAGGYAGYALSQGVFSVLYARRPELAAAMAAVPIAVAIAIALRVPSTPAGLHAGRHAAPGWAAHGSLLPLFLVQVFSTAINLAVIFLLPDLLLARGAPSFMVHGGGHFALVAGGCLSLLPAGHAADRWGARRVLVAANLILGVSLAVLLLRQGAGPADLLVVAIFGIGASANNVVAVAEGNRRMPGRASGVSAFLMGFPWCIAAAAPMIAGFLADPARGGSPTQALVWLGLAVPLGLIASASLRPVARPQPA
jgi:FSR family fosmidomycin resistance protein-like MFS transporter